MATDPAAPPAPAATTGRFPIIGIGASAGGIDAFQAFFTHLPADSGMAFVIILHLPADYKSMLSEILRRWSPVPVSDAVDGMPIEANHVYVPPPQAMVTITDGRLRIELQAAGDRIFRPIDELFDSLATAMRDQAVGIVLSGTGSDGALGLKAIKECGGLTIAQGSNGTAPLYAEMPQGAIATGAVDIIAAAEEIPGHLLRLRSARVNVPRDGDVASATDAARLAICTLMRKQLGHDFSGYRTQTFMRRVERRMVVVNAPTLDDYVTKLKADSAEITALFRDLLIRVTSFFRDQETFEALSAKVVPQLFEGKMADDTVRVWVPGCATGEEAYSLAILLREYMDTLSARPKVQLFASDIDDSAISTARLGRYPKTLLEGLSESRRERFFRHSHGSYGVTPEIRELCTFSVHNLLRDPPFSMMSLISCRNLLIYMNPELQARLIPVFHYSLMPGGILLLGSAESVAQHPTLFDVVDKASRIYRRRQGPSPEFSLRSAAVVATLPEEHHRHGRVPGRSGLFQQLEVTTHTDQWPDYKPLLDTSVAPDAAMVAPLQAALAGATERLQSFAEEYQTALEEVRSTNEELHSVNEELQSTNEELETSKEEMQSLNEELHTVNLRLNEKIDELSHSNSDLRNLFDSTEIATVFLDRHLLIRSFTPAIATIYNLIPSDNGRPLSDIAGHLAYDSLRDDVAFVLSSLQPLERQVERDDRLVHYIMRILPYREPDSTVSGVLITFVDVTSIVQAEAALVAADLRKDVFLATLSHELRNPLAPIRMAAQILHSPKLKPAQLKEVQTIIARQVTHMSSLLDDLLDVSRITRGSFILKKEYVDLQVLITDAVTAVQEAVNAKQHTLRVDNPGSPITLEVDPVRLTQVITNILTNAIKYTPSGGLIQLGTRLDARELTISVRDNGIGLSSEAMEKVFDMFTRIDSELGRTEGGLGVGLALSKGLVELHGGRIEPYSAGTGEGSEFMIRLPRTLVVSGMARGRDATRSVDKPVAARRILVADDNHDSARTMKMLLTLSGHEVHLAHSGAETVEMAKRIRPDVGIFDIGMPDLSGYEVAERLRGEAWGKDMILIAVTGWGQDSDKRRALAAGFNQHLTKPIEFDSLERLFDT